MNIYVLNTVEIGVDSLNILRKHLDIRGVIGLSERRATDAISGYRYMKPYCEEHGLAFVEARTYSLSDPEDRSRLSGLDIDLLIVGGWQRLIPQWLIRHCRHGVIGAHGSASGITGGRGRSPQNWALILGKSEFYVSIFKIDEGIDSGAVIDTRRFELTRFDDIRTSYYKMSWLTSHMIVDNVKNGKAFSSGLPAQHGETRYLPQRRPEDGEVDWSRTSRQVHDFVRALTRPYPGAFSRLGDETIRIWRGRPFDVATNDTGFDFGRIVRLHANGDFLVRTRNSFYLVEDYSRDTPDNGSPLREGDVLSSCDFTGQMREIVRRHHARFPGLPLARDILAAAGLPE
ncbi:MAG: methionyl-tRNA formyltransferase [Desulfatibacillaceae bacterium]